MDTKNGGKWINRFFTILDSVFFLAVAIVQVAVALNLEFVEGLVLESMFISSVFLVVSSLAVWAGWFKNKSSLRIPLVFTGFMIISTAGIFVEALYRPAVCINAFLGIALGIGSLCSLYTMIIGEGGIKIPAES